MLCTASNLIIIGFDLFNAFNVCKEKGGIKGRNNTVHLEAYMQTKKVPSRLHVAA